MSGLTEFTGFTDYAQGATWVSGLLVAPGEIAYPRLYNGFAYKATQGAAARTGTVEPTWPTVAGQTVADGAVTWECFALSTITWQAYNLHVTGPAEPAWPTVPGASVVNGTVTFTCRAPAITDPKCPHSKVVLAAAEKIFAADFEVVRYSATLNPLGWSPSLFPRDAGFLGTGERMQGDVNANCLAQYRGNMAVVGYSTTVIYQLDPDPARISVVDTIEGIGTPYSRAHASVMGDLYLTTPQGVRSLSLAASTGGLGATDVGTPVDELVAAQLVAGIAAGYEPLGIFAPGLSEFWLVIGNKAYVLRQSKATGFAGWAEYLFPFYVTAVAILGSDLHLLATDGYVYKVDPAAATDAGTAIAVSGETPFVKLDPEGGGSMTLGLESVASAPFQVQVKYDEAAPNTATAAVTLPAMSKPEGLIPVHLNDVPSVALAFSYSGAAAFELTELTLYHEPLGVK